MSATAPDPPVDLTSAEDDPVDSAATSKGLRTFGTKIKPEQESVELFAEYNAADVQQKEDNSLLGDKSQLSVSQAVVKH
ncbi:hypothetical protein WJX82_003415 [Trebouxia sp. C0006]